MGAFFREHTEYFIIHGHINSSAAIYLSSAKKHGRVAVVHSHATKSGKWTPRALAFYFFSYPIRYIADYFFACSKQAGADRFGKRVTGTEWFRVLNNGINTSKYVFSGEVRRKMREKYSIHDNDVVVGHVGRFVPQKNHEFLLKVFAEVSKMEPNAKLWMIGEGELEKHIRRLADRLGIGEDVRFIGVTDRVHEYLQAMDVFVFPSVCEGLGIALIEAEAAGLPCVVPKTYRRRRT